MTLVLDGKKLAKAVRAEVKASIAMALARGVRPPGLAVILVGEDPASQTYVASKEKLAKKLGFHTCDYRLAADTTSAALLSVINDCNSDAAIDGILLQLPLPESLEQEQFLNAIAAQKDADGLHPLNQGLLLAGQTGPRPCTPLGTMALLDCAIAQVNFDELVLEELPEADLSGKRAIVLGRSVLVGKPLALMLLERNATVVMAHSRTADLAERVREADIVLAAVGVPHLVKGDWVKQGAIVLDVGINRLEDGSLTGDVEYATAAERASAITPVPGGVGPMTIAMLLRNTRDNWLRSVT